MKTSGTFTKRSLFLIITGALLPLLYIIFLLFYNFQNNAALQASSADRYLLDIEKRAASLGYFFQERKYDLQSIAGSLEVATYLNNCAMGMSERYGVKVNISTVRLLLLTTIENKTFNNERIYKKIIFLGRNKRILADTEANVVTQQLPSWYPIIDSVQTDPEIFLVKTKNGYEVIVATPCFHENKTLGWIISWLNLQSVHKFFMDFPKSRSSKGFCMTSKDGEILHSSNMTGPHFPWQNYKKTIAAITDLELVPIEHFSAETSALLLTRIQVNSLPLYLTAYVNKDEIFGDVGISQLLAGIAALITLGVLGGLVFINASTKQLILQTRIDESTKQQNLLTKKNSLLEDEIIKRKQAERDLQKNEYRYRKLFELSSDAIVIIQDSTIIDCNEKTSKLFNVDCKNIINKEFCNFTPEIQLDGSVSKTECLKMRDNITFTPQRFEWVMKTYDGRRIDVEITMTLISTGIDSIAQVIIRDITKDKQTQELLVQTEKMLAVGGLAAGMAHEINNPLGVILQANQNISRRIGTSLPKNKDLALELGLDLDQMQKYFQEKSIFTYLESIQSAGERAAKIVRSMLEFGRATRVSTRQQWNLNELLDIALEMALTDYELKKKFNFANINIKRCYASIDTILCEKTEICQVFLNILKNAAQAMHETATETPSIILTSTQTAEGIDITMEDNGPGISEGHQTQIFEPFFTTKAVGGGIGLGLSVSYFIITSHHHGKIRVKSKPGDGSKFFISLPWQPGVSEKNG